MTEDQLISKIRSLKEIKPRKNWVVLTKKQIFGEEDTGKWNLILDIFPRLFFRWQPALVTAIIFLFLGAFTFARDSLPGDLLYPIKRIAEKSRAIFVSEAEKPKIELENTYERLEELSKITKVNEVKKLAPALNEFEATKLAAKQEISNTLKNKPAKEAIKIAKEVAPKLNEINEKEKQVLSSLGIEPKEEGGEESAEKTVAELLVKDLETRSLTERETELLNQAKEDIEAENYSTALAELLNLTQE